MKQWLGAVLMVALVGWLGAVDARAALVDYSVNFFGAVDDANKISVSSGSPAVFNFISAGPGSWSVSYGSEANNIMGNFIDNASLNLNISDIQNGDKITLTLNSDVTSTPGSITTPSSPVSFSLSNFPTTDGWSFELKVSVNGNKSFIIEALSITGQTESGATPVPLPPALPLLFSGLGGLVLYRRRLARKEQGEKPVPIQ